MKRILATCVALSCAVACGGGEQSQAKARSDGGTAALSGPVTVDGSSTVFPITEAVAEEFRAVAPRVRVTVGVSGTGGGFKKFIQGETDISDASRFIKQKEIDGCAAANREYIELPVAYDGLAVVVNKKNDFARSMTVAELRSMWAADSTARKWSDVRAGWPDREFKLYAPGQDSGTFDYFTEVVNGKSGNCRADATFSEDDNMLVRGVSGDPDGIGFFGFAYYHENKATLNIVAIDGGDGPVVPSHDTIEGGSYAPLSRPLFLYVAKAAKAKPQVDAFVTFYLENMKDLASQVGYVGLPDEVCALAKKRYDNGITGTVGGKKGSLVQLYQ